MYEALFKMFGSILIPLIPTFLLKRMYPEDSVTKEIEIAFPNTGDKIEFGGNIPEVTVRLNFINQSHLDVELDRINIELWYNQPISKFDKIVKETIKQRKSGGVYLVSPLNVYQVNSVLQTQANEHSFCKANLYIKAYFNTKIGSVMMEERIENIEPKIHLQGLDVKNELQVLKQDIESKE